MSVLTHMVLTTMHRPTSTSVQALNDWCKKHADGQTFKTVYDPDNSVDRQRTGGTKVFCDYVYALCGNYFPYRELMNAFRTFGWHEYLKETTVLIIRHESDDCWTAVNGDGCAYELGTGL